MTNPSIPYRPDIDGLRAIAVSLVLIFHFDLLPEFASGFMGVDVFFVISGFLITTIICHQLQIQTFQLKTFWLQRIKRLAPALVVTTVLTLCAGWFWLLPSDFKNLAIQTVASQLYFANVFYWRNVNYFGLQAHDTYLLHTWSLAVEEQFYFAFPFLLLVLYKYKFTRGHLLPVLFFFTLASFFLNIAFIASKPEATFYLMPTRAWELLCGSLIALSARRISEAMRDHASLLGFTGTGLLLIALVTYSKDFAFPGYFAILPVGASVLLITAGTVGGNPVTRFLSYEPLRYIGKISYPLYLVHWPINVFATSFLVDSYSYYWRVVMLFLSIVLGAAIHHFVEKPSKNWLDFSGSKSTLWAYGTSLLAIVAFSLSITFSEGAPSRFADNVAHLASFSKDLPPAKKECEYQLFMDLQPKTLCKLGSEAVAPKWFIYGDSHAWAVSSAIDIWLKQRGESGYFLFAHSCPPIIGVHVFKQSKNCHESNESVMKVLHSNVSLTHVFLVSTWRQAPEGILTNVPSTALSKNQSISLFKAQFEQTIKALHSAGKKVHVWEPLPGAKQSVPQAMARQAHNGTHTSINFSMEEYLAEFSFFFEALRKNQSLISGTFSPSKELCVSGSCISAVNTIPLYYDNGHLAHSHRFLWAKALHTQMKVDR
jgi:peptidoglycan/LPS O-acetylase OafA/YrhL